MPEPLHLWVFSFKPAVNSLLIWHHGNRSANVSDEHAANPAKQHGPDVRQGSL